MGDILSAWLRPAWMVDPRILGLQAGEYVKVNVMRNLYDKFRTVAARRSISVTEALQQALIVYTFVDETIEHGEKFLIEDRQGRLRQVFFDRIGQEAPPASRATKLAEALENFMGSRR